MKKVLILGGTTYDHIVYLDKFPNPEPQTIHVAPFQEATGSTGSGKALNMTKLGISNTLVSVLGNDYYGQKIIHHLKQENVDFTYYIDPKGTERHFNIMDKQGNRISMFITQSSENVNFDFKTIDDMMIESDLIVLNIISYCKQFVPLVEKHNKPVWTDLHDYDGLNTYHEPFINASQYIFLSSDNLPDYRQTMQKLMDKGKEFVICTHGKNGATALTKDGEWIDQPALTNFPIIDTNGAGDSFFSGFLYGYIQNKPIKECLQYGTLCGAHCITSNQLAADHLSSKILETEFQKYYGSN
jgi:sugar/nucleoside kinase (ribokinase family)